MFNVLHDHTLLVTYSCMFKMFIYLHTNINDDNSKEKAVNMGPEIIRQCKNEDMLVWCMES